jgi:hypothetical protein
MTALHVAATGDVARLDGGVWADSWTLEHCTAQCVALAASGTIIFACSASIESFTSLWLEPPAGVADSLLTVHGACFAPQSRWLQQDDSVVLLLP